jgi:hypothetical protein
LVRAILAARLPHLAWLALALAARGLTLGLAALAAWDSVLSPADLGARGLALSLAVALAAPLALAGLPLAPPLVCFLFQAQQAHPTCCAGFQMFPLHSPKEELALAMGEPHPLKAKVSRGLAQDEKAG